MLCVYSHLIIFHELYGFGVSRKIGFVCKTDIAIVHSDKLSNY